jgi:tetratricopeptide (TPR) repeat protein
MFNLKGIVDYIKRKNLRLNVRLPVNFAMTDKNAKQIKYQRCFTSDISLGGISISDLEMPPKRSKHLINKTIYLQFMLPLKKKPIEATGMIEWDRVRSKKAVAHNHLGIRFVEIDEHDILDLLAYGLNVAQLRTAAILLSIVLFVAGVYGVTAASLNHSKELVKQQLINSETKRQLVIKEVDALLSKKTEYEIALKVNERLMEKQKAMLSRQEAAIEERKNRIEILEDIFKLVSEEWDVGRDSATVIVDDAFRAGREELQKRNYETAISAFYGVLKTYPDSPLVYKMLYKALYLSGKKEEADQVYQKYFELLKKDILKGG